MSAALNGGRLLMPRGVNEIASVTLTLNTDGSIGIEGTLAADPLTLNVVLDQAKAHLVSHLRLTPKLPNGTNGPPEQRG